MQINLIYDNKHIDNFLAINADYATRMYVLLISTQSYMYLQTHKMNTLLPGSTNL